PGTRALRGRVGGREQASEEKGGREHLTPPGRVRRAAARAGTRPAGRTCHSRTAGAEQAEPPADPEPGPEPIVFRPAAGYCMTGMGSPIAPQSPSGRASTRQGKKRRSKQSGSHYSTPLQLTAFARISSVTSRATHPTPAAQSK